MLNNAGLAGTLATSAKPHDNIYGRSGLYQVYIDLPRDSGKVDRILCIFDVKAIDLKTYGLTSEETPEEVYGLEPAQLLTEGQEIMIMGRVQTYRDVATGHIVVFVLTEYLAQLRVQSQNGIGLAGIIARKPIYRRTPKGKKITDIILKVPSEFTEGYYAFIPVICWGRAAEKAAEYQENDRLEITGRLQSREYQKKYEDGREETLTAYEVSAAKVQIIQQTEKEQKENGKRK